MRPNKKISAVKKRRKELGITQRELAYEANISYPHITLLERGVAQNPTSKTIAKLNMALAKISKRKGEK